MISDFRVKNCQKKQETCSYPLQVNNFACRQSGISLSSNSNGAKKMELLAPAGKQDVLEAVIDAGCDSVYLGGKLFSMRQHGNWLNFSPDELRHAIIYAHEHNVQVFVTVNNLLTNTEIGLMDEFVRDLMREPPDALIVQDLGMIPLLRAQKVDIPIHASTMMNTHNRYGADELRDLGISRIVTSRDITIAEAGQIRDETGVEVEYFLHNDICAAQSGLCYLSGIATPDSSNRGRCLKPCRWQWKLIDTDSDQELGAGAEGYLMAKKDLCLYHELPELAKHGIDAVKIEGRARKADYLWRIVREYRQAIDAYYASPETYQTDEEGYQRLLDNRMRDFTADHAVAGSVRDTVDITGSREPRIFSIAVEERGVDENPDPVLAIPEDSSAESSSARLAVQCLNLDGGLAALESGADILYLNSQSERMAATNCWPQQDLQKICAAAKDRGAEILLTVPPVLGRTEQTLFRKRLPSAVEQGVDGFLVGSLGSARFIREYVQSPTLVADFSWNLFNSRALTLLAELGFKRATASLELSFADLRDMAAAPPLPLEYVVHGGIAGMLLEWCLIRMCLDEGDHDQPCSGHCAGRSFALTDHLGKRRRIRTDAGCRNRIMMEKDLCLLRDLPVLQTAEIDAFRIEGQNYEPAVLGRITALYRRQLDRKDAFVTADDWKQMLEISPKPLSPGAIANTAMQVAHACEALPTNEIIIQPPRPTN